MFYAEYFVQKGISKQILQKNEAHRIWKAESKVVPQECK